MDKKELLKIICDAEKEAAKLILHADKIIADCKTDARNVVTEYDVKVQNLLVNIFSEKISGAKFFCEEKDNNDSLMADHLFIIDPIDGTMNFVKGFSHSCISVAYAEKGKVCIGVVYNPFLDEMFYAIKGEGAFLNGKQIHIDDCGLSNGIACVGTAPYRMDLADKTFTLIKKLFEKTLDIRREGAAALDLCSVAAGRANIYFELMLSYWDYAAGVIIAEEAGAVSCTINGNALPNDESKPSIVCGGPKAVKEFLDFELF